MNSVKSIQSHYMAGILVFNTTRMSYVQAVILDTWRVKSPLPQRTRNKVDIPGAESSLLTPL